MRFNSFFLKTLAVLALFAAPLVVSAQTGFSTNNPLNSGGGFFNTIFGCSATNSTPVQCILGNVLSFLLVIAFVIALIFLIFGGFRYMTSRGNEEAIEKA